MGSITKGILGGFSGKVGTVVGGTWKGVSFMRSRPEKSSRPPTMKQTIQQAKFSLVIKFVSTMGPLLMITFNDYAVRMTGINKVVSYLLKNALTGSYPNIDLNYGLVMISRGDLHNATNPSASTRGNGVILFRWINNAGMGMAKDTDKAILVVYCEELNSTLYTYTGAERSSLEQSFDCLLFVGKVVHTYIGFISENEKDISNSIYTGQMTVS